MCPSAWGGLKKRGTSGLKETGERTVLSSGGTCTVNSLSALSQLKRLT